MTVNNSSQFPYQSCLMLKLPEETQRRLRDITNHFVTPLNILVAVMSFVCNALVIITVARTKSLQQPALLMLCSLAVTDLIYSQYSLYRSFETLSNEHMCPSQASIYMELLGSLCLLATLGNLAIISRDRHLAVQNPLRYRIQVTKSRAMKMICLPWFLSIVITVMIYLSRRFQSRLPSVGQMAVLLFFLLCFLVISFSYLGIFFKKTQADEVLHRRAILEREKRMANTVGFILLVLLVTFLPGFLSPLVLLMKGLILYPFRPFYSFLLLLNGVLNPLLNFGRNKEMRRALRYLLKCSRQVQPLLVATQLTTTTTEATAEQRSRRNTKTTI